MTRRPQEPDTEALVEKILDERFDAFRHWRDAFNEEPSAEPVHEVRVATRRLLAALVLLRPLLNLPDDIDPAILRRLERRLGKLRDLDVLGGRIHASLEDASGGGDSVVDRLEATIAAVRSEALKQACAAITRKRLRRLTSGLRAWLARPTWTSVVSLPRDVLAPDLLLPFLSRTLLHPGWQTVDPPDPDAGAAAPLHALRRQLKELRYAVECLADWYGEMLGEWLNELHAIQDALGAWHDEGLLLERLLECEETTAMRTESLLRARSALAPWPAWRARYLDPETRAGLRALLDDCPPTARDATPRADVPLAVYLPPPRLSPTLALPDPRPTA